MVVAYMMTDFDPSNMMVPTDPYEHIHQIRSPERATEEDLRLIVQTYPVIDNHAHNILKEEYAYGSPEFPFEGITSEAQGHALQDHTHSSLAHIQGISQLAEMFRCRPLIQDVRTMRCEWIRRDYPALVKRCLRGTHAILIDDGLAPEAVYPIDWHQQFVPTVSRIVRIESLAAELLEQLAYTAGLMKPGQDADWNKDQSEALLVRFNTVFRNQIRTLAQEPHVRGFKSVICYRSGLDIGLDSRNVFRPHQSLAESPLLSAFHHFLQNAVRTSKYRIQQKEVNDYLVVAVCDVLDKLVDTEGESLPIQFHTGLGDSDIDLIKANPAYMKPIIAAFPNVDFVLLHAAYPYTREAGYMVSTFANAWLDIGLIFPMLSRDGQELALRHALQLTPTSKILWSTDGHLHPETYYLANRQFRDVLGKILLEYVRSGDITISRAINTAVDILFWNSNQLYRLEEERRYPQLLRACGRSSRGIPRSSSNSNLLAASFESRGTTPVAHRSLNAQISNLLGTVSPPATSVKSDDTMSAYLEQNVATFDVFVEKNPNVKYIWITVVDYTGNTRLRMIPVAAFKKHLSSGKYPSITCALPRLMANDTQPPGAPPTGEFRMVPDLSSLRVNAVIQSPSATVQAWLMDDALGVPNNHAYACPRWALQKHVDALKAHHGLSMLMGFEIEVCFMRPSRTADKSDYTDFQPLNLVHCWSAVSDQDVEALPMIEEIVEALATVGIEIDQFHTEAAPGQWEFPLPAFEPVKAIDVLYKARDIIRWVANKHGLRATLYPRPYKMSCGTASHTHFSINGTDNSVAYYSEPFLEGILQNLPSILAFSLPLEESYQRISAGIWAGGEYVCWGTQNREVPLRKCGSGHWELKTVDGTGNMYLTMAALVASGLNGIRENLMLTHRDNLEDASEITAEKREELGIKTMLPKKLSESLDLLEKNDLLRKMLGNELIQTYVDTKRHEMKMLGAMGEDERRRWLMARH